MNLSSISPAFHSIWLRSMVTTAIKKALLNFNVDNWKKEGKPYSIRVSLLLLLEKEYSVYFILLIDTELFGKCNNTFPPDENNTSNESVDWLIGKNS